MGPSKQHTREEGFLRAVGCAAKVGRIVKGHCENVGEGLVQTISAAKQAQKRHEGKDQGREVGNMQCGDSWD